MTRIVVVGSGVSGAHAALTLLERGHNVEVWDVGRDEAAFPEQPVSFHELKSSLADPVGYFLGPDLGGIIPPSANELLRYPPSRRFLASSTDPLWEFPSDSFAAFGSFARGGLANGWGANALCFDENDIAGWPVSISEMDRAYATACARIPVAGPVEDELSPELRSVHVSQPPVELTRTDERLLRNYLARKTRLRALGVRLGRSRLAVVTDARRPDACAYCDRCLWGCPRGSIYNPARSTLESCRSRGGFRYVSNRYVVALSSSEGRITGVRYFDTAASQVREEPCDAVFLAAGALQTGAIFLRTLKQARVDLPAETEGLMDTAFMKIPYVVLSRIGGQEDARAFQFNRLILGMVTESDAWPRYLHGELLNLTGMIYYPLIERLPFDARFSKRLFFALKPALGAATLFFPDKISPSNRQILLEGAGRWESVALRYAEPVEKEDYIRRAVGKVRQALSKLGCLTRDPIRSPPGAALHYAGTVPMGNGARRCDGNGRCNLFRNLYIADGAAFPSLPSKSLTLSLAAHATRVATHAQL
ncbi:MAG TPA: GMC oxidoreductase [Casimicrobiaceae bacterium]|nr:GMC oxidoreductase [Casimicrobiaceae bacterium]